MITLEYSSNNSGGSFWLSDEDWKNLEAAGWKVEWQKAHFLGTLATSASFECETPDEGIASFVAVTGQDPWAEGCNCCGAPHHFSYTDSNGGYHTARTNRATTFDGWS
jgi:hypothetical protein